MTEDVVGSPATLGVQINWQPVPGGMDTGMTDATYVYKAAENSKDDIEVTVDQTFGADKKKKIPASHFATAGTGQDENGIHGVLYATVDNDIYILNGETAADCVTIRPKAGTPGDLVRIVIYYEDDEKSSIFDITPQETNTLWQLTQPQKGFSYNPRRGRLPPGSLPLSMPQRLGEFAPPVRNAGNSGPPPSDSAAWERGITHSHRRPLSTSVLSP